MVLAVMIVQTIDSLLLIIFILLHAGRGGGVSDMFGGGASSTLGGSTVVERNLDRLTIVLGLIFGITSLVLAKLLTP